MRLKDGSVPDAARPGATRHRRPSARVQILGWCVLLMAVALAVSVVVTRTVLDRTATARIDSDLRHEVDEIRALAARGTDLSGQPVAGVAGALQSVVRGAVPETNATLMAYLDGRPYLRSAQQPVLRLDRDARLTALWAGVTHARLGSVSTTAGTVRFAAVPITRPHSAQHGVVVAAVFVDLDLRTVRDVTRVMAETGLAALLLGFLLAWLVAGRILAPIRHVTELARSISDSDLTERIPVRGSDEISQLTATFNDMLDRLETAFQAQLDFVADAGHELRTPLTIIRGNLELLAAAQDDPADRRETIALVTDELDRMTRLVNDLLALARAQQPDFLQLDPAVDVGGLTVELVDKAGALADRDWRCDGAAPATMVADRQKVSQAMLQLAQNAAQHTAAGATIAIGSSREGGCVHLWVRDTGSGVPAADHERIFARFTRADPWRSGDGAGLGLAIVRSIAEAHGGSVQLRSTASGATFTMVLPARGPAVEEGSCPGS